MLLVEKKASRLPTSLFNNNVDYSFESRGSNVSSVDDGCVVLGEGTNTRNRYVWVCAGQIWGSGPLRCWTNLVDMHE